MIFSSINPQEFTPIFLRFMRDRIIAMSLGETPGCFEKSDFDGKKIFKTVFREGGL